MSFDLNIVLDVLLVVLLLATIVYCVVLNRRLSHLRNAQGDMAEMVRSFDAATEKARESVQTLNRTAAAVGTDLEKRIATAQQMLDELTLVTKSGERVAERIEKGVDQRKASAEPGGDEPTDPKPRGKDGRAAAESQLLQALRKVR